VKRIAAPCQSHAANLISSGAIRPSIGLAFFKSAGCYRIQPASTRLGACITINMSSSRLVEAMPLHAPMQMPVPDAREDQQAECSLA